jgi:hypothetical protein
MRRPVATSLIALVLLLAGSVSGCTDDDAASPATTTGSTTTPSTTSSTLADDGLEPLTLTAADLPPGFEPATDVDDTITAFCANEDATAGLQASGREVRGFTNRGAGSSVIQLVFRFREDGAATFVAQAAAILDRCAGVPDLTGLAFEYEPIGPDLDAVLAAASDDHVGRYGVSVGSGNLTIDLAVLRSGDVGQLVAVLGVGVTRPELDELAATVFAAVVAKP